MVTWAALLVSLASHAVVQESALLRGCDSEETVATVAAGDPVEIRFALAGGSGTCYKVSVESGGRTLQGYLPAKAIAGLEEFEKRRLAATTFDSSTPRQNAQAAEIRAVGESANKAQQLLKDNQPAEALRLLELALRANRRDAGLLAMAGLAAYQSDRAQLAVDYLRESIAMSPSAQVERLLRQAERELKSDGSSEKLFGARFHFRYDPKEVTADQARSLVPMLDSELARVSGQLGCRVEERIPTVIQSPQAYRASTGAAEWSAGHYDGRIRVALLEPQPGPETRRTLSHEIVHACLARTGRWPAWLHEGLAQKLSGDALSAAQWATVRKLASRGQIPPLAGLGRSYAGLDGQSAELAYTVSLAAAELLYQAYGADGVRSLIQSPERLTQVSQDLDRRLRQ